MLYRITHSTRYAYASPVTQCVSEARLTPRVLPSQHLREHRLQIDPVPAFQQNRKDYFGNDVSSFAVFEKHERFEVTALSLVDIRPPCGVFLPSPPWESVGDTLAHPVDADSIAASEFVFDSLYVRAHPELREYGRATFTPGRPLLSAIEELACRIHEECLYHPQSTSINTPLLDVLHNRRGVCQDFAHLMIGVLRSLRLAARYVSGYIRNDPHFQGAAASHAWVSVYDPVNGWLSFDPTNNLMPIGTHITLAWGRDYGDVAPVRGITMGGGGQSVEVEVCVQPLDAAPG